MRSFELLQEEHYSFERALKVLNRFLLKNDFSRPLFSFFFYLLSELIVCHLAKEKVLFTALSEGLNEEEEVPFSLLFLAEEIKSELTLAKDFLGKRLMNDFSSHAEEFILLFSRHIFQVEENVFSREYRLSGAKDSRLARFFENWVFISTDGKRREIRAKALWNSFLTLLGEMERV